MEKYKPSQKEIKKAEDIMTPKEETMSDVRAGKLAQFKSFFEENPVTGLDYNVLRKYAESLGDKSFLSMDSYSQQEHYLENKYGKEVRDGIEFIKKSGEKLPLPKIAIEDLRVFAKNSRDEEFIKAGYIPDSKEEKDYLSRYEKEIKETLEKIRKISEAGFEWYENVNFIDDQLEEFEKHFELKRGEVFFDYDIDKLKDYLKSFELPYMGDNKVYNAFYYGNKDNPAIYQEVWKVVPHIDEDNYNGNYLTRYERFVGQSTNDERFEKMKKTLEKFKRTPEDREKYEREKLEEERSGRNASQK